jgi:UDP-N-acetyl-2-amino-2-deoxyglucuronate dehydrogenase
MTMKIGLVGGGNISETHARAVMASSGLEIVAIQGTNSHRVAELSRQYGGKPYQEFESFLTHQPMDLIIIGSPSGLHATQGIAAAHRGLHILTEKPIDVSLERADQLIAAVKGARVKLGVIFQDRAKPAIDASLNRVCGVTGTEFSRSAIPKPFAHSYAPFSTTPMEAPGKLFFAMPIRAA